jgi:hypothetical protein
MSYPGDTVAAMELAVAALALAVLGLAALCAAGMAVWVRTRRLRHGAAHFPAGSLPSRTSATTLVPGLTGAMVTLAGVGLLRAGRDGAAPWILTTAGTLAAGSGFRGRVTRVEIHPGGLMVRYRARPPFEAAWGACRALLPPRWPLGAWTIVTDRGLRRLMPSDVLGIERALDVLVARSGLCFRRRRWRRPAVT